MPDRPCSSCGAAVRWVRSASSGKPMPLDPVPVPAGNIWLAPVVAANGDVAHYASAKNPAPEGAPLYLSHFATCPNAAEHRRRR